LGLKVVNAQMLAQPLEGNDSYKDSCEAEDETEEPEDIDADVRGRRVKCGIREALRSDCGSVCSNLKLGENAQQEDVGQLA